VGDYFRELFAGNQAPCFFAADVAHPYHQLLSPRLSDLAPGGHNTDSPPAGGIPSIALAPPAAAAAAFMATPSILGAFQPYSPFLPMMADSKTRKNIYLIPGIATWA
jgi:hypothetical protein